MLDYFLINIRSCLFLWYGNEDFLSELITKACGEKTSVQTVSYMKFLNTVSDHYKVESVH